MKTWRDLPKVMEGDQIDEKRLRKSSLQCETRRERLGETSVQEGMGNGSHVEHVQEGTVLRVSGGLSPARVNEAIEVETIQG